MLMIAGERNTERMGTGPTAGLGGYGKEPFDLVLPREQRQACKNHLLPGRRQRGAVQGGLALRGRYFFCCVQFFLVLVNAV